MLLELSPCRMVALAIHGRGDSAMSCRLTMGMNRIQPSHLFVLNINVVVGGCDGKKRKL